MGASATLLRDRAARLGRPLRVRDVRLMWLSDLFSVVGDSAAVLGLAVLVLSRTHSPVAVAIVSAAAFAPAFGIGPLLATIADRVPYRHVMIACDVFRAACYAAVLAVPLPFPVLVVIVFAAHCASFPFSAARAAQLPQISGEMYGAAQSLSQSTLQLGVLLGSAAGGALLATVGVRAAIGADVVSFVLSALLVAAVSARVRTVEAPEGTSGPSAWGRLILGSATLRRDPLLWWPAVMVTAVVVGTAAVEAMAVVLAHSVRPSVAGSGTLAATFLALLSVSTLIASVIAPAEGGQRRLVRVAAGMGLGANLVAAVLILYSGSSLPGEFAAAACYVTLGVATAITVPCVTVVGARLPDDNRASVFSLLEALLLGGQAVGAIGGGVLVNALGPAQGLAVLLCPGIVVCAVGAWRLIRLREPALQPAV